MTPAPALTQHAIAATLTPIERRLLFVLQRDAGRTVMFEDIVLAVWDESYLPMDASVAQLLRTNISRIRKKVPDVRIENHLTVGYKLVNQ